MLKRANRESWNEIMMSGVESMINLNETKVTSQIISEEESGTSCNSFIHTPCSVKSVEYRKLLFVSLGSPLVALEWDIFKQTKVCFHSEEI